MASATSSRKGKVLQFFTVKTFFAIFVRSAALVSERLCDPDHSCALSSDGVIAFDVVSHARANGCFLCILLPLTLALRVLCSWRCFVRFCRPLSHHCWSIASSSHLL